jgi:adenylate cyclase
VPNRDEQSAKPPPAPGSSESVETPTDVQRSLRPWDRFHVRLTVFHGGVVFVVVTAMAFVFYQLGYSAELHGLQGRLKATATILAHGVDAAAVADLDLDGPDAAKSLVVGQLKTRFQAAMEVDPDIGSIYLLRLTETPGQLRFVADVTPDEADGASTGRSYDATRFPKMISGLTRTSVEDELSSDEWGSSLSGYAPVMRAGGASLCVLGVDVAGDRVEAMRDRVLVTTLIFYGVAALLLTLLAVIAGRWVRGPLREIHTAAGRIADGDFQTDTPVERRDEFGVVSAHFNEIAKSLREREFLRDTFGRYVSKKVARSVLRDGTPDRLGGEEREVTIMFSDLQGYSTMNERLPPQLMVEVLNAYLAAMTEIIEEHEGCIIEFLGDAILTVFNAPADVDNHADCAIRCALKMRQRLAAFNREWGKTQVGAAWRASGFDRLKARVGIHTGTVVAGTLGSNTRVKYGLIGDAVNVAARLEVLNKTLQTDILMSHATWGRLPDGLQTITTELGDQSLKGRDGLIAVYSV